MSPHLVDSDPQAVIIDLGRIDIKTNLVKKDKQTDYSKEKDVLKLYDTMTIKFGKLKITTDYQLRTSSNYASEKVLNWGYSPYKVDVTNDINFGCELKTCLTPFNPDFPV